MNRPPTIAQRKPATRWRQGIASTVMLASLAPLLVVAGTLLSVESSHLRETESFDARTRARTIASGGAHDAISRLQADADFTGTYTVALDSGTAVVSVSDCTLDGVDNDDDGRVDDAGEVDLIAVRSDGLLGFEVEDDGTIVADHGRNWRGVTEVLLRRTRLDLAFDAATYVDDPLTSVRFSGNAFLISGYDVGLDGVVDRRSPRPAIGTPGDPAWLVSQFPRSQRNNVIGEGGNPSVHEVELIDVVALLETYGPIASVRFADGESFHGEIGDRVALQPVVAYAAGDLRLSGRTSGFGLLLVEGDLEIRGSLDYAGIIVVRGALDFRGGGTRAVLGTVLVGGTLEQSADLRGSILIQYSSDAIDAVRAVAVGVEVVAWKQS